MTHGTHRRVSTGPRDIYFLCRLGLSWQSWLQGKGLSSRTLGLSLGNIARSFPTRIGSYTSLGPLTWISIKKYVKLNETFQDTQGHFKGNLSNVKDVLKRLTSKLHETWRAAYKKYNNSYKDLINSSKHKYKQQKISLTKIFLQLIEI